MDRHLLAFLNLGNYEVIVFGVMMVIVLQRARDGLWPLLARIVPVREAPRAIDATAEPLPKKPQPPVGETILEAKSVTRKFGGLVANNNMSLSVNRHFTLSWEIFSQLRLHLCQILEFFIIKVSVGNLQLIIGERWFDLIASFPCDLMEQLEK